MTMATSECRADLERLLDLLLRAEVAVFTRPVVVYGSPRGTQRVTWAYGTESGSLYRNAFATAREYRDWVGGEAYSAILYDGSLLQLSFDFRHSELVAHRLVYYPCPFEMDEVLLREEPMLDVIDLYLASTTTELRMVSPLRFDFDLGAQAEGHPASHLTLNSAQVRWPVAAPLSTGHFVRFVFKHFYPALFRTLEFLRLWPQVYPNRTITPDEASSLHVSCGIRRAMPDL